MDNDFLSTMHFSTNATFLHVYVTKTYGYMGIFV